MFVYGCYSLSSHLTCKYGKMIISKVPDARCIQKPFHLLLPECPFHKPASKIWNYFTHWTKKKHFHRQNMLLKFIIFHHHETFSKNIWSESKSFSITRVVDDDDESDVEVDDFPLMNEKPYWVLAQTKLKAWLSPAPISLSDEEQI